MKPLLAACLFVLGILLPVTSQATIFFDTDWETGNFASDGWVFGYGTQITYSTDFALTGTDSLKWQWTDVNGIDGGNTAIERYFPASTHIFWRIGFRLNSGFQGSSNLFSKMWEVQGYPQFYFGLAYDPTTQMAQYAVANNVAYDITDNLDYFSNVQPSSTAWDEVLIEIQFNTPGQANGIFRMWINGVLTVQDTTRQFVGPTPSSTCGNPSYSCPSNAVMNYALLFLQSGLGIGYMDRTAIGDTCIPLIHYSGGCSGGAPQPPSPPRNLIIQSGF